MFTEKNKQNKQNKNKNGLHRAESISSRNTRFTFEQEFKNKDAEETGGRSMQHLYIYIYIVCMCSMWKNRKSKTLSIVLVVNISNENQSEIFQCTRPFRTILFALSVLNIDMVCMERCVVRVYI